MPQLPTPDLNPFTPRQTDPHWREVYLTMMLAAGIHSDYNNSFENWARGRTPGSEFRSWRYRRPHGRGRHVMEQPGCDRKQVTLHSSTDAFAPGQSVGIGVTRYGATIVSPPPSGLAGQSGWAINQPTPGELGAISISGHTPDVPAGSTTLVTFYGFGFRQTPVDVMSVVVLDDDPASSTYMQELADPYVSVGAVTWLSAETIRANVTAASDAPVDYRPTFLIERA